MAGGGERSSWPHSSRRDKGMLGLLEQMPDDDTEGARLAYRMEGKGHFGILWRVLDWLRL